MSTKISLLSFLTDSSGSAGVRCFEDDLYWFIILLKECAVDAAADEGGGGMTVAGVLVKEAWSGRRRRRDAGRCGVRHLTMAASCASTTTCYDGGAVYLVWRYLARTLCARAQGRDSHFGACSRPGPVGRNRGHSRASESGVVRSQYLATCHSWFTYMSS